MAFAPVFQRPFAATFDRRAAAAAAYWWSEGAAPTPSLVYQPIGAASLAASYSNVANPGTYDLGAVSAPSFASATGWTYSGSEALKAGDSLDSVWTGANAQFVILARIRTAASNVNSGILVKLADTTLGESQRQFMFQIANNKLRMFVSFALALTAYRGADTSAPLSANTTYTVAVVYDGTQAGGGGLDRFTFYVDGAAVAKTLALTAGTLGSIQDGTAQLGIGASVNTAGTASTYSYSGQIHALAVYPSIADHATWLPVVMAAAAAI